MKKLLALLLSAIMLLSLVACSNGEKETTESSNDQSTTLTVTSPDGTQYTIPKNITRIVSAAANITRILTAAGMGEKIVGADNYSNGIEGLGESVAYFDSYTPSAEAIIAMNPEIIIATDINNQGAFQTLAEMGYLIVYLPSPTNVDDIKENISFLGDVFGNKAPFDAIVNGMDTVISSVKALSDALETKKTVYIEISPLEYGLYSAGGDTFMSDMVKIAGGINIFENESGFPAVSAESVILKNPDVIFTTSDYDPNAVNEILGREGWQGINAIKNKQVYVLSGDATSQACQIIIEALEDMAQILCGYEG